MGRDCWYVQELSAKLARRIALSGKFFDPLLVCKWNNHSLSFCCLFSFSPFPAPGEKIFSTVVRGNNMAYAYYSGTSMAVPHVAAATALVWSHHPECTNVQIRYALAYTAKDIGDVGCDDNYGYGIVKTKKALDFINQYGCTGVIWGQTSSSDGKCSSIDAFPTTPWWWWGR